MALKVTHKHGTTSGAPPAASDIDVGEIAINAADAEIYTKDTQGNVRKFQNTTTGTAEGVTYTYTNSGELQTLQQRLEQYVSVEDFGAVAVATNSEPDEEVAEANTAAFNAAFAASSHVYVPGTKSNLFYFVTDTINVGSNRLEGAGPGTFGGTGVTIKCHSEFNVSNPLIKINSKGRVEELELIGINSATISDVPAKGIEVSDRANKVSISRVRMQYFRNGLYADRTQNSLFSDMQVKFCPDACYYLNELENCKFVNISSDQDIDYTPALHLGSRNIRIANEREDSSHSRNISFYMGIHERGNVNIDHCVELEGVGGAGLLFVDGEYNGGRKSAINVPRSFSVISPRFSLQGNNLAITNATEFTETGTGTGVFYPSASNGSVNLTGGVSASGLNGKSISQIIPRLSTSTLCSDKFGFIYSATEWSDSSGGSVAYDAAENALEISGGSPSAGGRRGAFTLTASPIPPTLQLAGRSYKIVIKVRSFNNCTGVTVWASRPEGAGFRRSLLAINSEGYHEAVVPANATDNTTNYDSGSFQLTPSGITSGQTATFLVDMFIVDII
jgi:hypothetical protein